MLFTNESPLSLLLCYSQVVKKITFKSEDSETFQFLKRRPEKRTKKLLVKVIER